MDTVHFTVKNKRTQSSFSCHDDQSILSAAIEAGIGLPHSCRTGTCGSCKALLVRGDVTDSESFSTALTQSQQIQGQILLCQSQAKSNIEIDIEEFSENFSHAQYWPARISKLKKLSHDVMLIQLQLPTGQKFDYIPGQFVDFMLTDNRRRSYSIAISSNENHLEFHIRLVESGEFSTRIFQSVKTGDIVRLYGPLGTFFIRQDNPLPIIFVAGGTGMAPIKAMLENLLNLGTTKQVTLYWGVCTTDDIYLKFWLEQFSQQYKWFNFITVLSNERDFYQGRTGLVHQAVLDDYQSLENHQVYASGPPIMIEAAQKSFIAKGLEESNFHFDSFEYSADTLAKINK